MDMSRKSLFCIVVLLYSSLAYLQAQTEIHVRIVDRKCDSVQLQSYNWKQKSGTHWVQTYQPEVVFKSKSSLQPGMYWICADTDRVAAVVIPTTKKQKITVVVANDSLQFVNSPESSVYANYMRQKSLYALQFQQLDEQYQSAQKLPTFMIQAAVDSLVVKARKLQREEENFQSSFLQTYQGTLAANLIRAGAAVSTPPQSYYNNPQKIQEHIMRHYFDDFPWEDPRVLNSSVSEDKIQQFGEFIYQEDRPDLDTFVVQTLKAAAVNETSLLAFFEKLDLKIGRYLSNYKVEHTYIKMLQYILTCPNVPKVRRIFYERELQIINKNLDGSFATDFKMVLSNGDTTSLYDIQSDYILLFLHNPTCTTCREVRRRIAKYEQLNQAIDKGRLKVVTVYMENDAKVWDNYLKTEANPQYVHGWNFDQAIEQKELYETRTIPYMFLLDKDKRIIRKNILVNEIETYIQLYNINQ